ncbi:hypothetical protein OG259_39490 [Streptomyces sp. NBC_00250]|uniref:hypothetical protein n=1 Tax=Streptomyces sp. NBC_00250 TaxID=2903641 RepID=UPI002E2B48D8|nr:hypothetical protein [Streptomyces sp. NBC_00250]
MNAGGERGGSSVPDDVWEQFLRDSVEGVADAPKEPSARARVVTERLRDEPAGTEGWRTYTPRPPRRKKGWYLVGFLAAVALLVVALDPWRMIGSSDTSGPPLAQESERPTEAPPVEPARLPTLDEPFKGSPALRWANGSAGITVPAARATGWMSRTQVEKALRQTRDFLVSSNLDPAVLRGERPTKAIALINPHQRDVKDYLAAAFRTPGEDDDPLLLFSRFDPSYARLVGDVVKARGRITYREGERGALQVTTDVTYVYPVVPAEAGSDDIVRTIVRREVVLNWDDPSKIITEPGTFSLVSYKADMTNGGCDTHNGYFTPEFGTEGSAGTATGGEAVDPYDRTTEIAEGTGSTDGGCRTATRS